MKRIQTDIESIMWMARRYAVEHAQKQELFDDAYCTIIKKYPTWEERPDITLSPAYVPKASMFKRKISFMLAVVIVVTFARRYAHGRMTYAPHMFNKHYLNIKKAFGYRWEEADDTANVPTFPYAQDGHYEQFKPLFDAIPKGKK